MLDHGCDNFGYSMAFGGVASHCFRLFFNRETLANGPPWSQTLYVMLYVLIVGLMFYPMFACLSTNWRFLGATMGLGYSTMCYTNLPGETIATQLPVLICLIGLSLRFLFIMFGIIILLASYQLRQLGKLLIPANQTANGTDEESIYQLKLFFTTTNGSKYE
ncbi:hypothetical protein MAR_026311 [Mya arenaria]|uniref:Uncharacterized protein n=1 Tax=Mya arenaria TaxID=6604 RepID=A0ABY7EY97_MYAAR|nr:hypothetical protein MAR_026311 [Mya arenaria]